MKKSKLFVLLPMVALLLSGCQTEVVPSDTPSESPSEETSSEEYTPSVSYSVSITNSNEIASLTVGDSVVVAVSLITTTDGVDGSVSGTASDVTLSCEDPSIIGIEGLRITALNEGSASIYASWTERGVASSSVTIEVSKEEEPPVTHEYTYGVSITNGNELSSLTEGDIKTVNISLITYEDGVESTSVLATSADVTLSSSATDVVSVSGLELTALSKGTSNISAKWDEHNVSSSAVTVSVSEKVTEEGGDEGSSGDTEPEPEPVISYKLEITNADEIREIQTGDTRLVEVTGYTYEDDIQTDATILTSENVTLISSEPDYLSVDGLTITALAAKEAITLTAVSETYGITVAYISVTANPDEEVVEDTYTYDLIVNNQQELQTLAYGYGYDAPTSVTLDITLITYKNDEYAYSQKADTTMTDLEVISWDSSIVTTSGLTVTAVSEGSTVVEVKWYDHPLNGGGEGFSDLSFFVNVEVTEYFEPFTPISKIGFSQDLYTFVFNDDAEPVALEVNYEPCEATNPSYTVFSDDESIAKVEYCETTQNYILSPVAEGETDIHVVATDTETNPAAGTSHVIVEVARNPILSFGTSTMNIELEVGGSATIGYAPTEGGSTGPDVEVYVNPDEPDNKAFTLSGEYDSEFLSISERDETNGLNTYTISAITGENAGKASHTYSLDITADDEYSDASTRIYVTILTDDAKARPVEGISLSVPYVTIANNGSFTVSNGDTSDVTVTVYGGEDGVYEDGWNLIDYDSTLLDVDFDFDTSVFTITAKEPDINQTVTTNLVFRTMGAPVKEARLAVYILRAEDYTANINVSTSSVSMLTDQTIVLGEDDNYSDFSVSIYNQYNEVLEGASWEASISDSSGLGVLNSVTRVDGSADRLSITSGSKTGTGVIRISAEDDESIYTEISVSVSQQYYEVEQISCSLGTINLGYDLANDPKGTSTYIQDSAISYYSSKGSVNPDYEGFSLEYAGSYLSIGDDNRTITALLPTGDAGVNITVRSTTNTNATTTINVVVNDVTDYAVKTLTINSTSIEVSVSSTQDNAPTDLAALGVTVTMSPEYATNTDYTVTSSDPSLVSVDGNNNITVKASKEDNSAELYIVASDNTYGAHATLTVNVKTTYVKADSITVNYSNTALTTGDVVDFDTDSYVVIGNTASGTVTDSSYTITSSNESVLSVAGHVVSAAGAGEATLTFTTADGASVTTNTITVTDPRTEAMNVTVYFRLTDSTNSGTTYTCPDYANIYCQGNFSTGNDTWDDAFVLTAETYNDVTCYKATISTILLDTEISYRIIFTYSGDDLNWNHQSSILTFSISDSDVADGGNLKIDAATGDPTTIIPAKDESLSQFSVTIATKNSGSSNSNVTFAVCGDLNNWASGGEAMTKVSNNTNYDQAITYDWERDENFKIYFGGSSSEASVWWDWNICYCASNYSPTWGESTAFCWLAEEGREYCFDLFYYGTGSYTSLNSYSNLTIIFTLNYSSCSTGEAGHNVVTSITTLLS